MSDYKCPYCKFNESGLLMHIRTKHPEKVEAFTALKADQHRAEQAAKATEPAPPEPEIVDKPVADEVIHGIVLMETLSRFQQHRVDADGIGRMDAVRANMMSCAANILRNVPDGRERALAVTKLEEAMHHANAGIARTYPPIHSDVLEST